MVRPLSLRYTKPDVEQFTKADRLRVSRSLRKKANPGATLRRLSSTVMPNALNMYI